MTDILFQLQLLPPRLLMVPVVADWRRAKFYNDSVSGRVTVQFGDNWQLFSIPGVLTAKIDAQFQVYKRLDANTYGWPHTQLLLERL
jgi:hypothetical protein